MNWMHWVPNTMTLANLCCGGLSIYWAMTDQPGNSLLAFALCLVFDLLDGLLARLLNAHHRLGAQLDSLADLVSFGMAPSIVLLHHLDVLGLESSLRFLSRLFSVFAALRLAKFNIEARGGDWFYGLPSPAGAVFVFGLYAGGALADECTLCQTSIFTDPHLVLATSLLVGSLMITDLRHFHFKGFALKRLSTKVQTLFLVAIPCFFFALEKAAIASLVVFYILLSLAYFKVKKP